MNPIHPALRAWRDRKDTTTHDALWAAACWAQTALEIRGHEPKRADEYEKKADGRIDDDAAAFFAVLQLKEHSPLMSRPISPARDHRGPVPKRKVWK